MMMPDLNFSPPQKEHDEVPDDHRKKLFKMPDQNLGVLVYKPNTIILAREMAIESSDSNNHFDEAPFFVVPQLIIQNSERLC
jgi:hypothetical protein